MLLFEALENQRMHNDLVFMIAFSDNKETHWDLNKMVDILQTIILNLFGGNENLNTCFNFGSSTGLASNRRQTVTLWWRHQMETFSALLAICAGNSPVPGEIPAQRPWTRSFDVFSDLYLNKRLSKQSWDWWLETPSRSLLRHCNGLFLSNMPLFPNISF